MQAYEFESRLEHGVIKAPEALRYADGKKVRVIVLLDENQAASHRNAIQDLMDNPIQVKDAKPFSRDSIYER